MPNTPVSSKNNVQFSNSCILDLNASASNPSNSNSGKNVPSLLALTHPTFCWNEQ